VFSAFPASGRGDLAVSRGRSRELAQLRVYDANGAEGDGRFYEGLPGQVRQRARDSSRAREAGRELQGELVCHATPLSVRKF
jgi:hypothetical protein